MQGKAKTYFISGLVFIIVGVIAIITGGPGYMRYGNIAVGVALEALASREYKNNSGN